MVNGRPVPGIGIVDLFRMKQARIFKAGCLLVFILMLSAFASAQDETLRQLTGTVFIQGETNDVTWDDIGISRWEAQGDVYLKFTSTEGNIIELWGDKLVYERRDLNGLASHWASVEGNCRLVYDIYTIDAGMMEGMLDPLSFDASSGVHLQTEQVEINTLSLSLVESDTVVDGKPGYIVKVPDEANALFRREEAAEPLITMDETATTLPIPIELNLDFETLDMTATGFELEFDDDGFTNGYFPNGGTAITDNGYTFKGSALNFDEWNEISAYECSVVGPDVVISSRQMSFFPGERRIELEGDVTFTSNEGGLMMDYLEIGYDENGVKQLTARGNVRIDLTLVISEDISLDERSKNSEIKADTGPV